MASRPSLVTPSGRFHVAQQQVSLSEDAKVEYRPVGLQGSTSRWQGNNGTVFKTKVASLTWTCTQIQITLLPTSSKELSIPPALLFRKDQHKR